MLLKRTILNYILILKLQFWNILEQQYTTKILRACKLDLVRYLWRNFIYFIFPVKVMLHVKKKTAFLLKISSLNDIYQRFWWHLLMAASACSWFISVSVVLLLERTKKLSGIFFFFLGFLLQPFTNHRTARERGGHFFNSSLPLTSASQTLRHCPGDYCRDVTSRHT